MGRAPTMPRADALGYPWKIDGRRQLVERRLILKCGFFHRVEKAGVRMKLSPLSEKRGKEVLRLYYAGIKSQK